VFLGSSPGKRPEYRAKAIELGEYLLKEDITLIYGGGDIGLMGILAETVMNGGGRAIGYIPEKLEERVGEIRLTEIHVVPDMHARKKEMYGRSDAFIVLPGGIGTLDELFETFTWHQLGYHRKPIGLLDACGFYEQLESFLDHIVEEGFMTQSQRNILQHAETPSELVTKLRLYAARLPSHPQKLRK
jgi:uncharacterized protein (TIGR00730 family)